MNDRSNTDLHGQFEQALPTEKSIHQYDLDNQIKQSYSHSFGNTFNQESGSGHERDGARNEVSITLQPPTASQPHFTHDDRTEEAASEASQRKM